MTSGGTGVDKVEAKIVQGLSMIGVVAAPALGIRVTHFIQY